MLPVFLVSDICMKRDGREEHAVLFVYRPGERKDIAQRAGSKILPALWDGKGSHIWNKNSIVISGYP